jgi:hypothetical protein
MVKTLGVKIRNYHADNGHFAKIHSLNIPKTWDKDLPTVVFMAIFKIV